MVDRVKYNVMPTMPKWLEWVIGIFLFLEGGMITGSWAFPTFKEKADFDWDIEVEPGPAKESYSFLF